jgi:hypothetical protein
MDLYFEEILPHMIVKYGKYLNTEISSVKFHRSFDSYYLTLVFTKLRGDISTYSTNMDIIGDDDGSYFKMEDDYQINKQKFLELDEYSLIMIIDNLFTEKYTQEIVDKNKGSL